MGYAFLTARCGECGRIFICNPMKVPSYKRKIVFCKACVDAANPVRVANGLLPIVYPPDAYEPCDELELE